MLLWLTLMALLPRPLPGQAIAEDPCRDNSSGRARQCVPDFVNAAFGRGVEAGEGGACEAPSCPLTDLHNPINATCWTSEPSYARSLNFTLRLGKKYELTYVSVQFCGLTSKPDSMAVFKSMNYGDTWIPMQFYSHFCRRVFGKHPSVLVTRSNEQEAVCSEDPNPLSTRVAFSLLEGRPSAYDFDNSPVLQDWVTATDIRIVLVRSPPTKLPVNATDSGFSYSVADLSVGGRCKCNGHASRCVPDQEGTLACECQHNTAGRDCERCRPFHFDRPWGRATARDAHPCVGESKFLFLKHFISFSIDDVADLC